MDEKHERERYYSLKQAPNVFPLGTKPSYRTIQRWVFTGCRCENGGRAYLGAVKIGRFQYTTKEMVTRFIRQVNGYEP